MTDDDTLTRIANLHIWDGTPNIEPLHGGISNESFLVADRQGKHVVRIGHDFPFHHVYRDREVMSARAAHAAGFAAEVEHAQPGLMVSRYIEGKVFGIDDVRANIDRIAEIVKRFHGTMAQHVSGPGFIFWPFHVNRDYGRILPDSRNPMVARLAELLMVNETLEAAQTPLPISFGHHDFLPANFIDDGQRLWIIDYEYAGFGTAMFDLANLSSNSDFSPAQSEHLLSAYFGPDLTDYLRRSHAAMECASLLREALWSLVAEMFMSSTGVDYGDYALKCFNRFDVALTAYRTNYEKA